MAMMVMKSKPFDCAPPLSSPGTIDCLLCRPRFRPRDIRLNLLESPSLILTHHYLLLTNLIGFALQH